MNKIYHGKWNVQWSLGEVKSVGRCFTLWVLPSFNNATQVSRAKRKSSSVLGPRPKETNTSMLLRTMSISALRQNEYKYNEQNTCWGLATNHVLCQSAKVPISVNIKEWVGIENSWSISKQTLFHDSQIRTLPTFPGELMPVCFPLGWSAEPTK